MRRPPRGRACLRAVGDVNDPEDGTSRPSRDRSPSVLITAIVAIVVAAAIAGWALTRGEEDVADRGRSPGVPPQRGIACVEMQRAVAARASGDDVAFEQAVREAARLAERTLDVSGQIFGRPERLALELRYALGDGDEAVDASLRAAADACSAVANR